MLETGLAKEENIDLASNNIKQNVGNFLFQHVCWETF